MLQQIEPLVTIEEAKQCAILMSSTEPWLTLKRDYQQCLRLFLNRNFDTFILRENELVICFCVMDPNNFPRPYIKCLGVHANFRGKGLGRFMIGEMERKYAHLNGKMFIAVSSFNSGARRLYESLGYLKVGEFNNYIVDGHSEILLEKVLNDFIVDARDTVYISSALNDMDIDFIFEQLRTTYWATNITKENLLGRMINSLCFGVFEQGKQKGFARVVTDYFSFAYLADVFIEENSRGKGYSRLLMEHILDYPPLRDQKWLLATRDAHKLYEKFGFSAVADPQRFMGKNGWRSLSLI
jgi:ribosomal protein S18 acetylase RimI-like enzyme